MTEVVIGDITWFRGDSYPAEIHIVNTNTGDALDITGYTFKLTVDTNKNPADDSTKLFELLGNIDPDPTTGKVAFTPTPENNDLVPKNYYYDIEMTDPMGYVRTIAKNKWIIVQDITK